MVGRSGPRVGESRWWASSLDGSSGRSVGRCALVDLLLCLSLQRQHQGRLYRLHAAHAIDRFLFQPPSSAVGLYPVPSRTYLSRTLPPGPFEGSVDSPGRILTVGEYPWHVCVRLSGICAYLDKRARRIQDWRARGASLGFEATFASGRRVRAFSSRGHLDTLWYSSRWLCSAVGILSTCDYGQLSGMASG